MANEVFMPKLGASMESGTILQWFKEEGESISEGEMLFEVMTDKVNIEIEADSTGVLLKKLYEVNDEVPVNQVIAYIGQKTEDVEGLMRESLEDERVKTTNDNKDHNLRPFKEREKIRATPAARKQARDYHIELNEIVGTGPRGRIQLDDVKEFVNKLEPGVKVTPLATKIAKAEQINLDEIKGSGVRGKVMSEDVRTRKPKVSEERREERIQMKGIRKVISQRMAESAFTAPHATITTEVDMSAIKEMRQELLPRIEEQIGERISYTEIIMKAVALMLKKHRIINSSLQDDYIILHPTVNIGLAVAAPDGLVVPVIKECDQRGLTELTEVTKRVTRLARENKLNLDQMSGSTFTISNLGMYAIDAFSPIINQPESAILGVGRILEKPVGVAGTIVLRPMMALSLSFDHRIIDGAPAAAFLTELKETLEKPIAMLA